MKLDSLIPAEALEFERLLRLIELRKDSSLLALVGVSSSNQKEEFKSYLLSRDDIELFNPNSDPIVELTQLNSRDKHIYLIDLFNKANERVLSRLQFARDYIAEYGLKVIFLFNSSEYKLLQNVLIFIC